MVHSAILLAAMFTAGAATPEHHSAAAPVNASSGQPLLRGSAGASAAAPAPPSAPHATGAGSHTEQVAQVLAATSPGVKANATAPGAHGGEVKAEWLDWGHGHQGETCCMCSYQYGGPTGNVVIYAAEDYDNFWGGHAAFWHCEHECERKCGIHTGGHKFGCLDEQHLRSLSRTLRGTPGFRIEHQHRFGNLC